MPDMNYCKPTEIETLWNIIYSEGHNYSIKISLGERSNSGGKVGSHLAVRDLEIYDHPLLGNLTCNIGWILH